MEIFEYLPQLIVAYDGNDKFANLIHVKKADKDNDYFCPCCGGIVKPRALGSTKEQSHYYHITGKCTKESQLHFFCKNWLFKPGSKFYINEELFEVLGIDVEKQWETPFGNYRPDITVYTSTNKIIYFEMFFTNRKKGDDYFCKWDSLGNDVVEVNIKEYMLKTDKNVIPTFNYLYHKGICYSKAYRKMDLYVNTVAKIKRELTRQNLCDYKARIEKLDWFWIKIQNNESKESILKCISSMCYDDKVSCYEIIKQKHCVSYLKNNVLELINKSVIQEIRKKLNLPYDENVYFDLKKHTARTYEIGIRLNIRLSHIIFDDFYESCEYSGHCFNKICDYPKVVFQKNTFTYDEINIPSNKIGELNKIFKNTVNYKKRLVSYDADICRLEERGYKIKVKNNHYTVLKEADNGNIEIILDNCFINTLDINDVEDKINEKIIENRNKQFLAKVKRNMYYCELLKQLKDYSGIKSKAEVSYTGYYYGQEAGLYINLWLFGYKTFSKRIEPSNDSFINAVKECKVKILEFIKKYAIIFDLISVVNRCKNKLWAASFNIGCNGVPELIINISKKYSYYEYVYIYFYRIELKNAELFCMTSLMEKVVQAMKEILSYLENHGYRIMFKGIEYEE